MANFLSDLQKKYSELLAPKMVSPLPQRQPIQPKQNLLSQFGRSPVGQAIVGFQKGIEQRTLPKVNLQPQVNKIQDPTLRTVAGFGATMGQDLVNLPQRLLEGGGRIGTQIVRPLQEGKRVNGRQAIGALASSAEPLFDIATLGSGIAFKQVAKQGIKGAIKNTTKKALLKGVATGAGYGATFGGLRGLAEGNEADFSKGIQGAGQGAVIGGALGGTLGVGSHFVGKVANALRKSGVPEEKIKKETFDYIQGRLLRNKRTGEFASNPKKPTPMVGGGIYENPEKIKIKHWQDVDKELGIPDNLEEGKLDLSAFIGKSEKSVQKGSGKAELLSEGLTPQKPLGGQSKTPLTGEALIEEYKSKLLENTSSNTSVPQIQKEVGGIPVYEKQVKGEFGSFDPKTGNIKVNNLMDNPTIIHEVTHKKYEALPQEKQGALDYALNELSDRNYGIFSKRTMNPQEDISYAAEEYLKLKNQYGTQFTNEFGKTTNGRMLAQFFKEVNDEAANNVKKIPLKSHTQLGSATNTRADQIASKFRVDDSKSSLKPTTKAVQPLQSQQQSPVAVTRQPLQNQSGSKINSSTTSIQRTVKDDFEAEMDAQIGKTFEKPFSGKSRVKAKQPVDLPGDQATTDFATGRMAMGDGGGIKGLPKDTSDQFQLWVNRRRATDIEGFLKKKEFKDLDNKGVNGIFEFQSGNKSGRFGDVKRYFDAKYKTLQDNKIEFDYRQDYLPQLWNNSQDEINQVFGRRLGTKPSFTLEALFKSYEEGMNAGLKPKFGNISDLVGWYEQKANKALADKRFFDYLGHDGQILPSGKAPQEWVTLDPDRFPKFLSQIGDEQFAGTYKAPKELADVINNYLQGARFPFLEKVAGYVSKVKNITLNFGIPGTGINMHGVNILARHTLMGTGGNPISRFITGGKFMLAPNLAAKELDKSMVNAPQAVKNGLSLSAEDYSGLMKQGEGFRAQFGRKWEAMFGDPLFNKMIPALKLSSYENLVKNGMNEKDAAKLINNVYGGINWEQMGRSKDMQNLIRIAILAPDWAESTLKIGGNFAKALNPLERSETVGRYRTMMATVFASYIAHNIVNKITSGHYSYENDPSNIFNIEIGYTDSGEKRYFRPYGTGLDMVRLPAEVAMGLYKGDLTGITRLLRNRLSIPAGVGLGLLTDQDYRGNAIGYRGTDKYGNEMPLSQRAGNITSEMASLVGVPAFTRQLYRGVSGQQGLEESLTQGLELPFRYSNTGNSNVQKQVDFIADEQGLKGKDRYDFNQQLKGQSKFSDNQLNVIKSYDNKSQGLKDTLQLRKVRSEVEKAKKGALKESGIDQADAAEETPITTNSNMQLEIAKSRVKMTKKTERVGDNIVYPTDTGSSTLSLTPPTQGSGIGAFANKDWNITKAREVWNNDQLSKEDKDYAFKKLGVNAEDVRYDALANYSNDIKSQYLSSKSDTKEKLINNILTGRKRSIGDNIFASDGVIDSLVDEGKLTKEEGKALKAIDYNKDGSRKIKVGSGRGKKIKIPKVKAITIKFNKSKRIKVKQIKPKKVKQYKLSKVTKVKKLKV